MFKIKKLERKIYFQEYIIEITIVNLETEWGREGESEKKREKIERERVAYIPL